MAQVTYRGYEAGDLGAMIALDNVCFDPRFRFSQRVMRRFAEAANARIVVAEADAGLAGFCIVQLERTRIAYLVTLDVAPAWRRQGIATEIMMRAEAIVCEDACSDMMLHVFVGNEGAIRFYEGHGYHRVGLEAGFYGVDADGTILDAAVYRKKLTGADRWG